MSALIDRLKAAFLPSTKLSPLELSIFDAILEKLPTNDAIVLRKQLKVINRIHRSPATRETYLYVMRNGKPDFPRELAFAKDGEFKMAVVDLTAMQNAQKLRARVWCVGGQVFLIAYKTSPKLFEKAAQGIWKTDCRILNYPS